MTGLIATLRRVPPSPSDLALTALGDTTRRAILTLLRERPLAVGEIALQLPISQPAVSQHLKVLRSARLVSATPAGTRRVYRLDPAGIADAQAFLDGFWQEALAQLKHAAETTDEESR